MPDQTLSTVAHLLSPLGPFQTAEERNAQEDEWINSLGRQELEILLGWLKEPTPIEAEYPILEVNLNEAADQVAEFIGIACKRLDPTHYRQELESLLAVISSRMAALAGLAALEDADAVHAIQQRVSMIPDPVIARRVASVLGSLGGGEALAVLQEMHSRWKDNSLVRKTVEGAIAEASSGAS